jgi:DNA-binding winged helix-turn-helix (wHTH) protein
MPQHQNLPHAVRFGPIELDLATWEIRRSGLRLRLQDQPLRILALLVQRPGELVTREQFREVLWPDDVFVDVEHGLNVGIAKLRRALGDTAEAPRYIETLERRGYRFVAPVEVIAAGAIARPTSVPAARSGPVVAGADKRRPVARREAVRDWFWT